MKNQTIKNGFKYLKENGIIKTIKHTKYHFEYMKMINKDLSSNNFKDVLFINGCTINYCERYRVHHKMEELLAFGLTCDEISVGQINEDIVKYYRAFVFYRTPYDKFIEDFINLAHENNKIVFYDIDDLIFDLEYTKTIKSLKEMKKEELDLYNDGVIRYGKLLKLCDYGITTTSVIANEMKKFVKDVFIDKNISSLEMQKYSDLAINNVVKDDSKVIIGYASGSLTHNEDFEMISDQLIRVMEENDNVYLKLIGAIDIPDNFKKFENRIIISPFVDYKKLPEVLRSLDIALAPLENTLFNAAKSSIKWMEAGLVKVPTVASDVGDFHDSIENGVDGFLCKNDEWYSVLSKLVSDKDLRNRVGNMAYNCVHKKYTAITSGRPLTDFISSKLNKKVCFYIPSANISGGILVATKHAIILKKHGYDVTMFNTDKSSSNTKRLFISSQYVDVVSTLNTNIDSKIDTLVATMWLTLQPACSYSKCNDVRYLVQGREDGFYDFDRIEKFMANSTYNRVDGVKYLTVSKWCNDWLKDDFLVDCKYVPNGIDLNQFKSKKRSFNKKIKILIEGDSESFYKNVDESFKIANKLDKNEYEIIYLSYNGKPKKWYRVDKFYNKVPYGEVCKIYQNADILIKSSILESFSYPPLEMMATGGLVVVVPNDGNVEYLKDNENCLFYEQGNINDAIEKIERLKNDSSLRDKLISNGLKTAKSREWKKIEKEIVKIYNGD